MTQCRNHSQRIAAGCQVYGFEKHLDLLWSFTLQNDFCTRINVGMSQIIFHSEDHPDYHAFRTLASPRSLTTENSDCWLLASREVTSAESSLQCFEYKKKRKKKNFKNQFLISYRNYPWAPSSQISTFGWGDGWVTLAIPALVRQRQRQETLQRSLYSQPCLVGEFYERTCLKNKQTKTKAKTWPLPNEQQLRLSSGLHMHLRVWPCAPTETLLSR